MSSDTPAIAITDLVRRYGRTDAVNGLSLRVQPGRCYGFFGRNGAGKTTTIKCLLNLLRPTSGSVSVFGMNPAKDEVAVKSRLSYVPDHVGFYPWMTVRDTLEYVASFRSKWNHETQRALLDRFRLYVSSLNSSGMRAFLMSFPVIAVTVLGGALILAPVGYGASYVFGEIARRFTPFSGLNPRHVSQVMEFLVTVSGLLGLGVLVMRFGYLNHRSADRSAATVRRQIGWIVLSTIAGFLLLIGLNTFLEAGTRGRMG